MNSILLRSHSTRHPDHTTSTQHASGSLEDSPLPPRPKSTLGFSSRFAQNWKASIASSGRSTTRSSPVRTATSSPSRTPIRERPSTPLPFGRRRQREAALAPLSPITAVLSPQIPTSARRAVVQRKPETPRTKAIHIEWRIAARQLEGDCKDCLMGAECLKVFDPLEGVKSELIKVYSPKKANSHLVFKPTLVTPATISHSFSRRDAVSPTLPPLTLHKTSTRAHTPSPTPLCRRPLATRRTIDPNPVPTAIQAGVTPRSARRMRHSLRMTPMTSLKPVCYVPLKSPTPSPRVSRVDRQVTTPSPRSTKTSSAKMAAAQEDVQAAISMESSYHDGEMECSIIFGETVTPPSFDYNDPSALSPWHVVRPNSPMSDEDEIGASEWIITSPIRPQTDRLQATRRWRL